MTIEQINQLFVSSEIMTWVVIFFIFNVSLILFGIIIDLFKPKIRRWRDTLANIFIGFVYQQMDTLAYSAISLSALVLVSTLIPYEIPMTTWSWILGLIVADFSYYWMHRIEHKHRILWASHSVHHSSQDYNLSISLRLSMVEGLYEWIFLVPMLLMGFNPFQTIICLVFVVQYQTWIHTQSIHKLGWLDYVFNTPSAHRVHHGANRPYLDKNFGGVLMVWDHLFRTFAKEEEKVEFGLTKNINSNNPLIINFVEYKNIYGEVKQCRNLKDKLRIVFGNLIWKPAYLKKTLKNKPN